jgi:hypothetical protein
VDRQQSTAAGDGKRRLSSCALLRWQMMTHKKPTPILGEHNAKICPVCGKRSYSAGGIHPQCAVQQADAPREQQLKAKKKT